MRTYRAHIPVPALTEFADVNNMMLNNMIKLALARAFDYPDCKRTKARITPMQAEGHGSGNDLVPISPGPRPAGKRI